MSEGENLCTQAARCAAGNDILIVRISQVVRVKSYGAKMSDSLTPEQRSKRMALIGAKNSKPEMTIRRLVFSMGYRYRLHRSDLPGKPDLVFPSRKKVIFVHGCFWHRHNCRLGRLPKSRLEFWLPKLEANRLRDQKVEARLSGMGWRYLVVWECEIGHDGLSERIKNFLEE